MYAEWKYTDVEAGRENGKISLIIFFQFFQNDDFQGSLATTYVGNTRNAIIVFSKYKKTDIKQWKHSRKYKFRYWKWFVISVFVCLLRHVWSVKLVHYSLGKKTTDFPLSFLTVSATERLMIACVPNKCVILLSMLEATHVERMEKINITSNLKYE